MTLGELLKTRRNALCMSLEDVAQAAGTTRGHLHALENGHTNNPGLLLCLRLGTILDVNIRLIAAAAMHEKATAP